RGQAPGEGGEMYRRLARSRDNVMGYEVSGTVTEDDYLEMVTELREVIDDFGGARVLVRVAELPNPDFPRAFSDRIEPLTDELGAVERYALVSDDPDVEEAVAEIDETFPTELRVFDSTEEEVAWDWVSA